MNPSFLVNNLAISLDYDEAIKHSYKNYHNVGLNYINLFRDERITIKLYLLDPAEITPNSDGFLVNPHNHRYNFSTTVLFGSIYNVSFREDRLNPLNNYNPHVYHRFDYQGYQENSSFVHYGKVELEPYNYSIYYPGESYHIDTHAVHSLELTEEKTGLLLIQYRDTILNGTKYYGRTMDAPNACKDDRLYQKYTKSELKDHLIYAVNQMERARVRG